MNNDLKNGENKLPSDNTEQIKDKNDETLSAQNDANENGISEQKDNATETKTENSVADAGVKTDKSSEYSSSAKKEPVSKGGEKEKRKKVKTDELGREIVTKSVSTMYSVTMAVVYIVFVLIASGVCSYFAITIANDLFAFEKAEVTAEISLGEFVTVSELADILGDEGIIKYPTVFKYYARLKQEPGDFQPGKYTVSSNLNYDSLLAFFKRQSNERVILTLTIPEGFTVDEIIDLFVSNGMGTEEGFVDAIQNGDYSDYKFIQLLEKQEISKDRKYRLEGYLFPDTYEFYQDWSESRIIRTLLDGFDAKFDDAYYDAIEQSDMTLDEYIILASMIESEAKYSTDFEIVSSVFHNRLNSNGKFPYLESDATIQYVFETHKNEITPDDLKIDTPYNTYLYEGLPPGAICNPGSTAILTAIQPGKSNYYYFVSRSNGEMLYASTKSEHNKNIAEIKAER